MIATVCSSSVQFLTSETHREVEGQAPSRTDAGNILEVVGGGMESVTSSKEFHSMKPGDHPEPSSDLGFPLLQSLTFTSLSNR